jgi:hypothetical protein
LGDSRARDGFLKGIASLCWVFKSNHTFDGWKDIAAYEELFETKMNESRMLFGLCS